MGKKVACSNCGQMWMSLSSPPKRDCFFCGSEGTVEPIVPDKLEQTIKKVKAEATERAQAKQRETHEREAYARVAEADQAEHLAARDNPADAAVRAAMHGKTEDAEDAPVEEPVAGKADDGEEDDEMTPAPTAERPAIKTTMTPSLPPGIVQVRAPTPPQPRAMRQVNVGGGQQQVMEVQEPQMPIPQFNATDMAVGALKKSSSKVGNVLEWLDEHKELVEWGKQVFVQVGGVMERHSQRQAELRREEMALQREMMERGLLPGARQNSGTTIVVGNQPQGPPPPPPLPDYVTLPLEERIAWTKKGGMKAYYAQQQAAMPAQNYAQPPQANQYVQQFIPAPTQYAPQQAQMVQQQAAIQQAYAQPAPPPGPLADANGRALDMTKKNGLAGLIEARRAMGLPDQVGAVGAFKDKNFQGFATPGQAMGQQPVAPPVSAPHAVPSGPMNAGVGGDGIGILAPPLPAPGAAAPLPESTHAEGEEILPPEMRALPKAEKEALLLANNIVKEETAHRIVDAIGQIPAEHVIELVQKDRALLGEKLRNVLYLLPKEQRNAKAIQGLMDTDLRDLIPFIQGQTRELYKSMNPDRLVDYICSELPDHRHLHEPKTKAWLAKNFKSLRDSMA